MCEEQKLRFPKKERFAVTFDEEMFYALVDGRRIAKRPLQGGCWISLEPGWTVRGGAPGPYTITMEYDPKAAKLQ
jgi:hypothetical protein